MFQAVMSARSAAVTVGLLVCVAAACDGGNDRNAQTPESTMPERPIEEVLREHTDSLMTLPGVVGTAEGECGGAPCIKVLVVEATPELSKRIPPDLDGYAVEMLVTGEIRARGTE